MHDVSLKKKYYSGVFPHFFFFFVTKTLFPVWPVAAMMKKCRTMEYNRKETDKVVVCSAVCSFFFLNEATTGIILGTHREKGAYTFWSYALGFPLASSSILSWKFCHVLHKVLRDGHRNVRRQVPQPFSSIPH